MAANSIPMFKSEEFVKNAERYIHEHITDGHGLKLTMGSGQEPFAVVISEDLFRSLCDAETVAERHPNFRYMVDPELLRCHSHQEHFIPLDLFSSCGMDALDELTEKPMFVTLENPEDNPVCVIMCTDYFLYLSHITETLPDNVHEMVI